MAGMRTSDPAFKPEFCPNPACAHHLQPAGWRWLAHGTFRRKATPHLIRRFRCLACRRCFSTQTFDTTYWLKRPDVQRPLHDALVSCTAFRQAGRSLGVSATTLGRQSARLGRHCLLFQAVHAPAAPPPEELVLDGLMTFEYSQYWPFEINVMVGATSHFVYAFTESELRRSGRMTERQRNRRQYLEVRHGRPASSTTRRAVEDLVLLACATPAALTVRSDEHQAYPRAFRRIPHQITQRARRDATWTSHCSSIHEFMPAGSVSARIHRPRRETAGHEIERLSHWETGETSPPTAYWPRIVRVLGSDPRRDPDPGASAGASRVATAMSSHGLPAVDRALVSRRGRGRPSGQTSA